MYLINNICVLYSICHFALRIWSCQSLPKKTKHHHVILYLPRIHLTCSIFSHIDYCKNTADTMYYLTIIVVHSTAVSVNTNFSRLETPLWERFDNGLTFAEVPPKRHSSSDTAWIYLSRCVKLESRFWLTAEVRPQWCVMVDWRIEEQIKRAYFRVTLY